MYEPRAIATDPNRKCTMERPAIVRMYGICFDYIFDFTTMCSEFGMQGYKYRMTDFASSR